MEEEWKAIPDFPGYEVSNCGQVRSYWRLGGAGGGIRLANIPQKILRPRISHRGYCMVDLCKNGKRYFCSVHRLVLITFVGPCPPGFEACHNDGKRQHNVVSNLRWDSYTNNRLDMRKHGTHLFGDKKPGAKLNDSKAIQTREMFSRGVAPSYLAKKYSVSRAAIYNIINRKSWNHV